MTNRQTKILEASMQRLTVWTFLLILAVAGPAWSVPQIMTDYGDQMAWRGSEINSMGGTGAALYRGGMSNIFNPAFLVQEESVRLDVGFSLDQHADGVVEHVRAQVEHLHDHVDQIVAPVVFPEQVQNRSETHEILPWVSLRAAPCRSARISVA